MTTPSSTPATRETSAFVRDRGERALIATLSGSVVILRPKGLRNREYVDLSAVYEQAVKARVARERAERKALKRGRK